MHRRQVSGFVVAAVLVRSMDAGATVALVLLCSAAHLASPLRTAGLLGAALTAPHALGFLVAPVLDRAREPRVVVAVAAVVFAVLLGGAGLLLGTVSLLLVVLLVLAAGALGPLLTGGLSSVVASSRGAGGPRRIQAVDALTYGVAGAAAPLLVATASGALSALGGLLALSAAGVVGGLGVLGLPGAGPGPATAGRGPGVRAGLLAVWRRRPLRRVALLTWLAAGVVAAAVLAGVSLGESHGTGCGAWVAGAFGLGNLTGALLLSIVPPRVRPERGMAVLTALLAPALLMVVVCAGLFAGLLATYVLLGLLVAPQTVLSLAAREELAPREVRGSVFVTVAGTKVAFSSAGTAVAGAVVAAGAHRLLAGAAVLVSVGVPLVWGLSRQPRPVPRAEVASGRPSVRRPLG
ncbi:MFS transporter [Pedococcus ginsenosidimutans]|uniref:MFS transporter n=1 Tax=Pedococcus ginsenosidimutans TaxID=490570 RepID=A0ABP8YK10_9MICO